MVTDYLDGSYGRCMQIARNRSMVHQHREATARLQVILVSDRDRDNGSIFDET